MISEFAWSIIHPCECPFERKPVRPFSRVNATNWNNEVGISLVQNKMKNKMTDINLNIYNSYIHCLDLIDIWFKLNCFIDVNILLLQYPISMYPNLAAFYSSRPRTPTKYFSLKWTNGRDSNCKHRIGYSNNIIFTYIPPHLACLGGYYVQINWWLGICYTY